MQNHQPETVSTPALQTARLKILGCRTHFERINPLRSGALIDLPVTRFAKVDELFGELIMQPNFMQSCTVVLEPAGAERDTCNAGQLVMEAQATHVAAVATQPIAAELAFTCNQLMFGKKLVDLV